MDLRSLVKQLSSKLNAEVWPWHGTGVPELIVRPKPGCPLDISTIPDRFHGIAVRLGESELCPKPHNACGNT